MVSTGTRARQPDEVGTVVRDGVRLAYEVHGDGPVTVLLLPTWSIIPSRFWKAQVPYLARHYRVVTFDGRGSGDSEAPAGAAAYLDGEYAADAEAVMDATGTPAAVVVGLSCGVTWGVHLAARQPDRVLGLFAIGPSCGLDVVQSHRGHPWSEPVDNPVGWAQYNREHWLGGGLEEFRRFFFDQMYNEPHSSKAREDGLAWSADITAETLVATTDARIGHGVECASVVELCGQVRCPVEVVHGTRDRVRGLEIGERLAELTGGSLTVLEGSGHGPNGRDPVRVNLLLRDFVDRVCPPPPRRRSWVRATNRPQRALFLCSPIGLGHVRRDLAVAAELRLRRPDLRIDWLAQPPVSAVISAAGEHVHPASRWLAGETAHIESEAGEHDLHAFQAIRRMDEILLANFMLFDDIVTDTHYDLVLGDEAWEVDHFLHENPELKRFPYAWMTDFVGWLPMPSGGETEAALTADYNLEMLTQRARFPRLRDRSLFVGSPQDVVDVPFGPGLPDIRSWTQAHFDFTGYITGSAAPDDPARTSARAALGLSADAPLCVVTVGGSGVGASLLQRVLDAVPHARRLLPGLQFLVVAGPRIDPASLPSVEGALVVGYLPRLSDHLAAADVAVVQGGLSTCMELAAAGTPFLYVPLENHFEQNIHVRHRLERYDAGRCLPYAQACDPVALAEAVVKELTTGQRPQPVESDGASRAADLLAEML